MRVALRAAAIGMATLLASCTPPQEDWRLTNITGLMPELAFALTDHTGERVDGADFRGGPVVMYFGYTHCPDVCPTTLATVRRALGRLEPGQAEQVQVLFVTVDPDRDTRRTLARYVNAFGPQFVGLRGDPEALGELTRRYRVVYNRDKPDEPGYLVAHSSALFVFDGQGDPRLVGRPGDEADAIARDLRKLLAEG